MVFCFACRARTQPLVTMDRGSSHTEPCARRRGSSGLSERSRGRTRVAPPLSPPLAETAAADRDSKRAATSTDAPVTSPPPPHHPINHHAFPLFPSSNSPRRRRLPPPSPPRPFPSHTAGRVAPPLRLRRRRRLPAAPVSVSQASVPSRVEGAGGAPPVARRVASRPPARPDPAGASHRGGQSASSAAAAAAAISGGRLRPDRGRRSRPSLVCCSFLAPGLPPPAASRAPRCRRAGEVTARE